MIWSTSGTIFGFDPEVLQQVHLSNVLINMNLLKQLIQRCDIAISQRGNKFLILDVNRPLIIITQVGGWFFNQKFCILSSHLVLDFNNLH